MKAWSPVTPILVPWNAIRGARATQIDGQPFIEFRIGDALGPTISLPASLSPAIREFLPALPA